MRKLIGCGLPVAHLKNDCVALQRMDNVGIVVESLDAAISFFAELGLELEGRAMIDEVVQYNDVYRLCYVRGPEGILVGLAEEIGWRPVRLTRRGLGKPVRR